MSNAVMDDYEIYRANVATLVAVGVQAGARKKDVGQRLGYEDQSRFTQVTSKANFRRITPAQARSIEEHLGLPKYWMDTVRTEEEMRAVWSGEAAVAGEQSDRRRNSRRSDDLALPNIEDGPPLTRVPLISWVQAGDFCEAVDPFEPGDADEWVDVVKRVGPSTYALRVKGESMEPRFAAGSILIVDPSLDPLSGSFVIAKEGGECTFKQFVRDGFDWYLKPLNDRFPVKAFREGMSICGVVVMHLQELR